MKEQYTIVDAKNKLTSIIHSVETGHAVKLTRHGKPVAVLLSIKDYQRLNSKKEGFYNALNSWRESMAEEDVVITGEEFDDVRDNSSGRNIDLL
ncbi:MAG: type II toxin-antitoxin system Phd/YefM family antitoxin [Proteobacteria bacterium]|nr:type II toxin-antitoxin system Phd/YefM family antitoxin [Pseudomonadota bacterium]